MAIISKSIEIANYNHDITYKFEIDLSGNIHIFIKGYDEKEYPVDPILWFPAMEVGNLKKTIDDLIKIQ